jgi:hypothetical protein
MSCCSRAHAPIPAGGDAANDGGRRVLHVKVKEVILSEINVISAKITSLVELEEENMESERKWTEVVTGGTKSPYINDSKLYQTPVISNSYE